LCSIHPQSRRISPLQKNQESYNTPVSELRWSKEHRKVVNDRLVKGPGRAGAEEKKYLY
jgi:hypothetical protein